MSNSKRSLYLWYLLLLALLALGLYIYLFGRDWPQSLYFPPPTLSAASGL